MGQVDIKSVLKGLYPIIDAAITPAGSIEKAAAGITDGRAKILQLRAKELGSGEFLRAARAVRAVTAGRALFIINDRIDVAMLAGADGVHLGQKDIPLKEARKLLGNGKVIGVSTHNIEEAHAAERDGADYISLGPIFLTNTKMDAETPRGLSPLLKLKENTTLPIVAIGGIKDGNIAGVLANGADAVAMISGILPDETGDIGEKVRSIISYIEALKNNQQP